MPAVLFKGMQHILLPPTFSLCVFVFFGLFPTHKTFFDYFDVKVRQTYRAKAQCAV